jgi:hypothetical protein
VYLFGDLDHAHAFREREPGLVVGGRVYEVEAVGTPWPCAMTLASEVLKVRDDLARERIASLYWSPGERFLLVEYLVEEGIVIGEAAAQPSRDGLPLGSAGLSAAIQDRVTLRNLLAAPPLFGH